MQSISIHSVDQDLKRDLALIRRIAVAGSRAAHDVSDLSSWAARVRELDPRLTDLPDPALLRIMVGIAAAHLANEEVPA
jgi:hypothetical protein